MLFNTSFHAKVIALFVLVVAAVSCKKDKGSLDVGVQPTSDLLGNGSTTNYTLTASTIKHDSIYSFGNRIKFLGSINDDIFGRTDVGLYLNMNFSQSPLNIPAGSSLVAAEIVLTTDRTTYEGDVTSGSNLTFSLFPLDSALAKGRVYSASNNRLHNKVPLATAPTVGISDHTGGRKVLRIPVDTTYAKGMIEFLSVGKSLDEFQKQYKGLYIFPAVNSGSDGFIVKCDLEDSESSFNLTCKTGSVTTTFSFTFSGDKSVKYNTIEHDHSTADLDLQSQLASGGTGNASNLYLQGLGGTKVKFHIPIEKMESDSFAMGVNRAELRLFVAPNTTLSAYTPPPFLSLLAISSTGKDTAVADQYNVTDNFRYNGNYDASADVYVFNIARHTQAILDGKIPNRGFHLVVSNPSKGSTLYRDEYAGCVVLGGPLSSTYRPVFTLSYSRVRVK